MEPASDPIPEIWGGLECSINRVRDAYFNQLESSKHFLRPDDIYSFIDLGIKRIRYPILWEQHEPDKHAEPDFGISAPNLDALRSAGVEVIAGLVHHGSGPAYVSIVDASFEQGLVRYAEKVAACFPWINWYTPVNEPLTTARFCGLYGLWYPHENSDVSFCRILINELRATVLAMQAIRKINPDAKLLHTDDLGKTYSTDVLQYQADFENNRRWLSYDLLCGKVDSDHPLWNYLICSEITESELYFFTENPFKPSILGFNHYLTSERYLDERTALYPGFTHGGNGKHQYADVEAVRVGHICPVGAYGLLKEAWVRFGMPMAVTEVHLYCTREEQMRWLSFIWETAVKLRKEGVDMVAVTPWALLGSFDWNSLLTSAGEHYEPGVFDLGSMTPRPTILARMMLAYSKKEKFYHPVLDKPGWWERSCRVLYGKELFYIHEDVSNLTKQLLIIGYEGFLRNEITDTCTLRGLDFVFYSVDETRQVNEQKAVFSSRNSWAAIYTGPMADSVLPAIAHQCHEAGIKLLILTSSAENLILIPANTLLIVGPDFELFLSGSVIPAQPDPGLVKAFLNLMNSSLDLLIDDEQGAWNSDESGHLTYFTTDPVVGIQKF